MKRIILFRYHKYPEICKKRLSELRKNNPNIKIYGIFGGDKVFLENKFEDLYVIKENKWRHFDISLKNWYKDVGYKIDFDIVHVIEWDLVYTKPLEELFKVSYNENLFPAYIDLKDIENKWYWSGKRKTKEEVKELKEILGIEDLKACLCAGISLCKSFLEEYSKTEDLYICNDELKLVNFAEKMGYKNTKAFDYTWFEDEFYNCDNREVVLSEKSNIFHPIRK